MIAVVISFVVNAGITAVNGIVIDITGIIGENSICSAIVDDVIPNLLLSGTSGRISRKPKV